METVRRLSLLLEEFLCLAKMENVLLFSAWFHSGEKVSLTEFLLEREPTKENYPCSEFVSWLDNLLSSSAAL